MADLNEFVTVSEYSPLGVWCHELGHLLFNWPDIAEGTSSDGQPITHTWCLMSSGGWNGPNAQLPEGFSPAHPCAPLKVRQGWIEPGMVRYNGVYTLPSVENNHTVLHVIPPGAEPHSLFIENRARVLFDEALAGNGLLLWDVIESGADSQNIVLLPAGGSFDLDKRGTSDDPYPGSKGITAMNKYGVALSAIKDVDSDISFKVLGLPSPRPRPSTPP